MSDAPAPARFWWMLLALGLIGVAAGILAIVYPKITLGVVALIIGIYLLISGVFELVAGIADGEMDAVARVLAALLGIVSLIAGVIVLRHPGQSLTTIAIVAGLWLIVVGVLQAFRGASAPRHRGLAIGLGIVDVIVGIIVVAWPNIGLVTFAVLIGIGFLLRGLGAIVVSFQVRRFKDVEVVEVTEIQA